MSYYHEVVRLYMDLLFTLMKLGSHFVMKCMGLNNSKIYNKFILSHTTRFLPATYRRIAYCCFFTLQVFCHNLTKLRLEFKAAVVISKWRHSLSMPVILGIE